jgi:hypothetical protein
VRIEAEHDHPAVRTDSPAGGANQGLMAEVYPVKVAYRDCCLPIHKHSR